MTFTQIQQILTSQGFQTNAWLDLGSKFKYILLNSDRTMFCHGSAIRFYFPQGKDFFLVKYMDGKLRPVDANMDGYEPFTFNGVNYKIKVDGGGKLYNGKKFHDIISLKAITGLFKV
jgi:hypothetical protein